MIETDRQHEEKVEPVSIHEVTFSVLLKGIWGVSAEKLTSSHTNTHIKITKYAASMLVKEVGGRYCMLGTSDSSRESAFKDYSDLFISKCD